MTSSERAPTLSERAWPATATVRFGWAEFRADNPFRIVASTIMPRGVFQCVFYALLGRITLGPSGALFAFVGSLGAVITLTTVVAICDVPMNDKRHGTSFRIRTSRFHPYPVLVARAAAYPLVGLSVALVSLLVGAPLVGLAAAVPDIILAMPCYAVMALTSSAAGLAVGALAVGKRADVILGNAMAYLILLTAGVFLRPGAQPWIDTIGSVIPLRHGLAAARALMSGRPWERQLLLEVVVGAIWVLLGWAIVTAQAHRARARGFDEFG